MSELDKRGKRLLVYGLDDWVGLWEFRKDALEYPPVATNVKGEVMRQVRHLLTERLYQAGELERGGLGLWNCDAEQSIGRISELWDPLGTNAAQIENAIWFCLTPAGRAEAEAILNSGEDLGFPAQD